MGFFLNIPHVDIQRANVDNNLVFYTFFIDFTWVSGYPACQCGISREPTTTAHDSFHAISPFFTVLTALSANPFARGK